MAVRGDLAPGLQAAQAVHATVEYALRAPESCRAWHSESNFIVVVSVPDEDALVDLVEQAAYSTIRRYPVYEPDLGDEMTAVAFQPEDDPRSICAQLPLALREAVSV